MVIENIKLRSLLFGGFSTLLAAMLILVGIGLVQTR